MQFLGLKCLGLMLPGFILGRFLIGFKCDCGGFVVHGCFSGDLLLTF